MERTAENQRASQGPGFSLAERDRRWGLVRGLMAEAGLDILLAPNRPDSRYLTQMAEDAGPAILPIEGDVTALCNRGQVGSATRHWLSDVRSWGRRWTEGMIDRLHELNADRKIIGIAGLDGLMRAPDGDLNYGTFVALREAFPHARWVGASILMNEARYRKSPEEVEFITRAVAATDAGLLAAAEHLRESVSDRELWGQVALAMLRAGTDPPAEVHLEFASMAETRVPAPGPPGMPMMRGRLLVAEAAGRYGGYGGQGLQPVALGPLPKDWADAWKVQSEAWDRTMGVLRPGVTLGEVADSVDGVEFGKFRVRQTLHGQGLGDDMPLVTPHASAANRMADRTVEVGVCLVLKPWVGWAGSAGELRLKWADTVVITANGARRLGTRPRELIVRD